MVKTFVKKDSLDRLKEEVEYLINTRRKEVAERIRFAKEMGDLSENADYAQAKDEQAFVEGRIVELKGKIKNAVIIDDRHKNSEVATIGSTIEVKNGEDTRRYTIVGTNDADPTKGYVSNESPIGRAFLGKRSGDSVEVETPGGKINYNLVSVG